MSHTATAQPAMSKPEKSLDVELKVADLPLAALLREIHLKYGKSPYALGWDMLKRALGRQKLLPEEYMQLRLFDDRRYTPEQKAAFVGRTLRRRIAEAFNPRREWDAVTDNKLVTGFVLNGMGFPTVPTVALFGKDRKIRSVQALRDREALAGYLRNSSDYPLFGKPIDESLSLGTVGIERYEQSSDTLIFTNGNASPVDAFADEVANAYSSGYLFQPLLRSHPNVAKYSGRVTSCVRFYTLVTKGRVDVLRVVWKIPVGKAMADNFWRGNLLAQVDPDQGRIVRCVRGHGLAQVEVERHPDTDQLLSELVVPDWEKTRQMVHDAAGALSEVRLLGWDIAISDRGPVILEVNNAPDFMLAQLVEHRGVADSSLMELFEEAEAANRKARRRSRFNTDIVRKKAVALRTAVDVNSKIG